MVQQWIKQLFNVHDSVMLESQADISYWLNQTPDSYFFISSDTSCFCAHILLHVLQQ